MADNGIGQRAIEKHAQALNQAYERAANRARTREMAYPRSPSDENADPQQQRLGRNCDYSWREVRQARPGEACQRAFFLCAPEPGPRAQGVRESHRAAANWQFLPPRRPQLTGETPTGRSREAC